MLKEFKKFISKGNVVDLAVGVVIGSSFGKIVSSLVNDIIMPLVGIVIGGIDFSNLVFKIGSAKINYGIFIQNTVDFLIVSFCIFIVIKAFNKLTKKKEEKQGTEKKNTEQVKTNEEKLLEEIRDLLKSKRVTPDKKTK